MPPCQTSKREVGCQGVHRRSHGVPRCPVPSSVITLSECKFATHKRVGFSYIKIKQNPEIQPIWMILNLLASELQSHIHVHEFQILCCSMKSTWFCLTEYIVFKNSELKKLMTVRKDFSRAFRKVVSRLSSFISSEVIFI